MRKPNSFHPKRNNNQRNSRAMIRNRNRGFYDLGNSRSISRSSRNHSYNKRNNQQTSNLSSSLILLLNIAKVLVFKIIIICLAIIRTFVMFLKRNGSFDFKLNFKKIFAIGVIVLIAIVAVYSFTCSDDVAEVKSVTIGSNEIGNVVREGPYGDSDSPNKIAIILGTHPRESGAHKAMYNALKNRSKDLNSSYYVYKIKLANNVTDFEESRMEGQKLAQEFVVKDIVNNNFTFAVDAHYSNGFWGVSRFVFTPVESNAVSYNFVKDMSTAFSWIDYYNPGSEASSPHYLTTPLNQQGVPAIVYEAYTEDNDNVTYNNDIAFINFIDNYNWGNGNFKG